MNNECTSNARLPLAASHVRKCLQGWPAAAMVLLTSALPPAIAAPLHCEDKVPTAQEVTGALQGGSVVGNNVRGYAVNSFLPMAVVHAGLAQPGQSVAVQFSSLGERDLVGTRANGIASDSSRREECAMRLTVVAAAPPPAPPPPASPPPPAPTPPG